MRISIIACTLATLSTPAFAHFKLDAPASLQQQDALGSPQKTSPCGQADAGDPSVPTNAVTTVLTGSMLTIKLTETVFHPGHYRVSLAQDQAGLPLEPTVTPGATACGSVPIDPNPTLPVLADGLLVHAAAFPGQQTIQVQLPAGMECTNCVVQVLEFMSNHGAPCFYHHCATVTISNTVPTADAGVGNDAGVGADATGGCCSTSRGTPAGTIGLALGLALAWRRRRR